ncbi:MAG: DoxX family protein [Dehalococcoidia bacterium]
MLQAITVVQDSEQAEPKHENSSAMYLLGRRIEFSYHSLIVPFLLIMRVTFGFIFGWSGFQKLIEGFSAEGFLTHATSGPLHGWFAGMAGNEVVEGLVVWGEILIGLSLMLGLLTRFASLAGATLVMLFYLSQFPPEHNPFMDYYLVYILVFSMLSALGAGRVVGLDKYVERLPIVQRYPLTLYLLG